ncbi:MAG: hypothetical protein JNG88_01175 [Phycisphaerales bacterium]|nr:hypothetical protein [Phycisphaerales bacterium]
MPSNCADPLPPSPPLVWKFPDPTYDGAGARFTPASEPGIDIESGSATFANTIVGGTNPDEDFVFVVGTIEVGGPNLHTRLYRLDPDTGRPPSSNPYVLLRLNGEILQTPAVSPISTGDSNLILTPSFRGQGYIPTDPMLSGVRASFIDEMIERIDDCGTLAPWGAYGSVTVHDWTRAARELADGVVASDNSGVYSFDNIVTGTGALSIRDYYCFSWEEFGAPPRLGNSYSGTPVVFPDRHFIVVNEDGEMRRYLGPAGATGAISGAGLFDNWYITKLAWRWVHMAGDSAGRFYVGIAGSGGDGGLVYAFQNARDPVTNIILRAWGAIAFDPRFDDPTTPPPLCCDGLNLRRQIEGPPAIDEDGTLIISSRGYVLALRPLLGDLNGDGCRNNFDIDAFALAITDSYWWEHTNPDPPNGAGEDTGFGERFGVNLLGVADCNNDGVFNNFDITPFVNLIVNDTRCSAGYGTTPACCDCSPACSGGGEGAQAPGGGGDGASESSQDQEDEAGWAHFWEVVGRLYAEYGS